MIRPVSDYVKSVSELANFIGVETSLDLNFSGITSDSRSVITGDLFAALPGAINFSAEGTVIGDGRKWDTVQFVPVNSEAEVAELAAKLDYCKPGESYVMGIQVVLDSITLP